MTAERTQGIIDSYVPGSATVRPRRAAGRFAELPIAQAALNFASARHAGQYRETDHAPFIAHPIKTGTTSAEIQRRFGTRVARLVESVSDDPSVGDYKQRKRQLRDRIAHTDPDTCAIFAADRISKVRELVLLPMSQLHRPKPRAELTHYRASLTMLRRVARDLALVDLLDTELNRLVTPAVTGPRGNDATTPIARTKHTTPRARTT